MKVTGVETVARMRLGDAATVPVLVPEQLEPTVTALVTGPYEPVHESVYVPATETGAEPVIGDPNPVLKPPPVQLVTLTQDQLRVDGTDAVGLPVNVQLGAAAAETLTSVHGPQLLNSSLSVITPVLADDDLSAQARTYHVAADGNV